MIGALSSYQYDGYYTMRAYTLPDHYWWYIRNLDKSSTGVLVPFSRHQDPYWAKRFNGDYAYPAPLKHKYRPAGGGNAVRITKPWWDFTRSINTSEAWRALRKINGGWINFASNKNYGTEYVADEPEMLPVVEGITSIDNPVNVLERKNNSSRIETFLLSDTPPSNMTPATHPHLFCHFTSIDSTGRIGHAPAGIASYFPLLAKAEAWIPDRKLNFEDKPTIELPELPKEKPTIELPEDEPIIELPEDDVGHTEPAPPIDPIPEPPRGCSNILNIIIAYIKAKKT